MAPPTPQAQLLDRVLDAFQRQTEASTALLAAQQAGFGALRQEMEDYTAADNRAHDVMNQRVDGLVIAVDTAKNEIKALLEQMKKDSAIEEAKVILSNRVVDLIAKRWIFGAACVGFGMGISGFGKLVQTLWAQITP